MATIGKMLSNNGQLFNGFGYEINTILLDKKTGQETPLTKLVSPLFHFEGDKEDHQNLKEIEVIVPFKNISDYFFYSSDDTSMYKKYFQINSSAKTLNSIYSKYLKNKKSNLEDTLEFLEEIINYQLSVIVGKDAKDEKLFFKKYKLEIKSENFIPLSQIID